MWPVAPITVETWHFPCCCVALMESMRSLDASQLPLNREQFLDLASSLNEFFVQNGLVKPELSGGSSSHSQQMMPQPQMQPPANFRQQLSPHVYQNYPDDQSSSPGILSAYLIVLRPYSGHKIGYRVFGNVAYDIGLNLWYRQKLFAERVYSQGTKIKMSKVWRRWSMGRGCPHPH